MVEGKHCTRCKEWKDIKEFSESKENKSGRSSACMECLRAADRLRYKNDPERRLRQVKWGMLKWKFGLTKEGWHDLILAQNSRCAICLHRLNLHMKKSIYTPHVDHDHGTGEIRGVLCKRCNQGIGLLQDSSRIIENAAIYLKRYGK